MPGTRTQCCSSIRDSLKWERFISQINCRPNRRKEDKEPTKKKNI